MATATTAPMTWPTGPLPTHPGPGAMASSRSTLTASPPRLSPPTTATTFPLHRRTRQSPLQPPHPSSSSPSSSPSPSRSPDPDALTAAARHALQTSDEITAVPVRSGGSGSASTFRTFRIEKRQHQRRSKPPAATAAGAEDDESTSSFHLLRTRPPSALRLLRLETDRLHLEAETLAYFQQRRQDLDAADLHIPRLLAYQPATGLPTGPPYLITGPHRGTPLTDLSAAVLGSAARRAAIERSLGRFLGRLGRVRRTDGGGGGFGLVRSGNQPASTQATSWAQTFAVLLESVLRDGEDAMVSLPYETIRAQVRRHWSALERVRVPRVAVLEVCGGGEGVPGDVLVDLERLEEVVEEEDGEGEVVTGLQCWATVIWGDPRICDAVCWRGSKGLVEGFEEAEDEDDEDEDGDDGQSARVRRFLYMTFHALLAVVRACYRPCDDGSLELEARRTIIAALTQLASLPTI